MHWSKIVEVSAILSNHSLFVSIEKGSTMVMPRGLATVIVVLLLGFIYSMAHTVRSKTPEIGYKKAGLENRSGYGSMQPTISSSAYRDSANEPYALPNNQKSLTYCVIDGRLVDS
jgi:hypothetical protein